MSICRSNNVGIKSNNAFWQVFLLLSALACIQGCCTTESTLSPSERDINQLIVKTHQLADQGGYRLITTSGVEGLINSKRNCLIVDTLPLPRYEAHHIEGAVSFWFPRSPAPVNEWDTELMEGKTIKDFKGMLGADKERPVVFYCGRTACDRSHSAAAWAVKLGYKEVYRYAGGINAWLNRPWDGRQPKPACTASSSPEKSHKKSSTS
ncbi:rhodanese-like domain-containing protein [Sansalvadorimonas sp. 2012CJ34-2]|uniref:Rhodanese-like domain-containing protein n=1 Tax=Parendozoicomonas callyspongiae TaxID=2942213 RepID=A0ABT0PHV7_9GAMM|nr:rhodanese-like domain-containing protein [Sansalvadorimonas sp. 2012CJ34-2]MCL6270073.1 rhodanese-like domain-containing protein [Sansalvadorimonas sp. 2012CJ34-2]